MIELVLALCSMQVQKAGLPSDEAQAQQWAKQARWLADAIEGVSTHSATLPAPEQETEE